MVWACPAGRRPPKAEVARAGKAPPGVRLLPAVKIHAAVSDRLKASAGKETLMRRFRLGAAAVVLAFLCGGAAAQQTPLVERDDRNDPCRRFKMRVLVPAEPAADPMERRPAPGIDPGIIRDPCRRDVPQLALAPPAQVPGWDGGVISPPPFSFPPTSESRRGKRPPEGPFSVPSPVFEFMRRRR